MIAAAPSPIISPGYEPSLVLDCSLAHSQDRMASRVQRKLALRHAQKERRQLQQQEEEAT